MLKKKVISSLLFCGCLLLVVGVRFSRAANFEEQEFERFLKSDPFSKQENVAAKESGAQVVARTVGGEEKTAEAATDENLKDDSYLEMAGTPFEVIITFPKPTKISGLRIFPGIFEGARNPSGECGIKSYQFQGYRSGSWFDLIKPVKEAARVKELKSRSIYDYNYTHTFQPVTVEKVRLLVLESGDTGCRLSSPTKPIIPEKELVSVIREIEVFSAVKKSANLRYNKIPLDRRLATEFVLPAYLNSDHATLFFQPTRLLKSPLNLEVSFSERITGLVPAKPMSAIVNPGSLPIRLKIPITSWPDGEYLTRIRDISPKSQVPALIIRVLRKQTILEPALPEEPIGVQGITMLFVDDWYLKERKDLSFKVCPAEQFPIIEGALEKDRTHQLGTGMKLDPDGTFVVSFLTRDRMDQNPRYYTARSNDVVNWTITENQTRAQIPGSGQIVLASAETKIPVTYRFYDPAVDGLIPLDKIYLKFAGYEPTNWGDISIPAWGTYPVWEKTPGNFLILMDKPLVRYAGPFSPDDLGDWQDANDNFGGQWLSKDGKTLYYCQARQIHRHPPFQILYDNLWNANRILTVWRTNDGRNWTPTLFAMPTEDDPVGWQHYGAGIFPLEGKNLFLAYLFTYNQKTQQIYIDLNYSRDSILWHRFLGQPAFAANGPFGSWNFGWIFPTGALVEKEGMVYQFLGYCNNSAHFFGDFTDGRPDLSQITPEWMRLRYENKDLSSWPFWKEVGSWEGLAEAAKKSSWTLGIMRYRKDGWVALRPEKKKGYLVTKILRTGTGIALNGRTAPDGSITVELLDQAGNPIAGYSGKDAAVFSGDSINFDLTWKQNTVRKLPVQPLRLRITLNRAELFALRWY